MRVPFAEWRPDQPVLGNATHLENVVPSEASYLPFRALAPVSDALGARAQGGVAVQDTAGSVAIFAGDATALYKLGTNNQWADVSRVSGGAYGTVTEGRWQFLQFRNDVIAINGIDAPQVFDLANASPFEALAGSPPVAKCGAVVRNFVVLGNIGAFPNKVAWSGFEDATSWTATVNQSGEQELFSGGHVQAIAGGEEGVIFCERSIYQMRYTGGDFVFQFDEVEPERGTNAPGSVAQLGSMIFFLSPEGFFQFQGGQSRPIGANKVDQWFYADLNEQFAYRITSAICPCRKLVLWSYPSSQSTDGVPDSVIMFHWPSGRWARASVSVEYLFNTLALGLSLEGLDAISTDLDALIYSLDSKIWQGGAQMFGGFSTDHKFGAFEGDALAATIDTEETRPAEMGKVFVQSVSPLIDAGGTSVSVVYRETPSSALVVGPSVAQQADGRCPVRVRARQFKARCSIPAAAAWTHAQGVEMTIKPNGRF